MSRPRVLSSWLSPETKTRLNRSRRSTACRLSLESLEARVVPSALPTPNPIDPTRGQSNLLRVVQMQADKQNLNAQDHFPVPFTIIASAGGAAPTVMNWHAGAPTRIDADRSRTTGQGGSDIQVEVNTERYTNAQGQPDWRLRLNVNRIGTAPFAQNLSVVVAFPWDAFNTETLPAQPNLLMGFQTRLAGLPGDASYITGVDGGVVPLTMQMVLTPHTLAGTSHEFEWSVDTTGASNPLTFLSGEFDGNPGSNTIANALAWSAYVKDVPAHIGAELKVNENAIGSPAVDSKMDLHWTSSTPSLVAFDYLEAESRGAAASPQTADYATQIVADKTPTDERFVLRHDEAGGKLTLNHDGNAPIHEMTFLKRRSDGLALTGVAADDSPANDAVPTHVALTLGLQGYETLDVNADTLDLNLQATQVGGFNNTSQFFEKYNLEYVALKVKNAPDQTAAFDGVAKKFTMLVTNDGENAPFTEMVLDDNGRIGANNVPTELQLPEKYAAAPPWNLWSIVDDGTHGTAVARALDVTRKSADSVFGGSATFDHDADTVKETVELRTTVQHPMETFLQAGLLSAVQPPPTTPGANPPDPYVKVQGHVEDVPVGRTLVGLDFPLTANWESEEKIGEICMAGYIGTLNFGTILEDNPTNGGFDFRPEGSIVVKALNDINKTPLNPSDDIPDFFTGNAAIVYDVTGFDKKVLPWPDADTNPADQFHTRAGTFFPNDTPLKEARLRLDHVPSMKGTWMDEPQHTYVDIETVADRNDPNPDVRPYAYVGGVQIQVSTTTTLAGTELTCDNVKDFIQAKATDASKHYALLKDVAGQQTLGFGIFGVDSFHFASDDTGSPSTYSLDYVLDPSRPLTPGEVIVDTHPSSTGALGTFFGGSEVTGPLTMSAVSPELHIQSDFDPSFSVTSVIPPIPPFFPGMTISDVNQMFTVDGTNIFVQVHNLAPKFTMSWNVDASPNTVSIISTQLDGTTPARTGYVELLFQNPAGLPGGGSLFSDPADPLKELKVRLDDVPSLTFTTTTGADPQVTKIDTDAVTGPFSILGGIRLSANDNPPVPILPPANPFAPPAWSAFPDLTGSEDHYLRLRDAGGEKLVELGLIGVNSFQVTTSKAAGQSTVAYTGNVDRKFTAMIYSDGAGNFFGGDPVDVGLVVDKLPQTITLNLGADGKSLSYTASSGISSITAGGTQIVNSAFNPSSSENSGTYKDRLFDFQANSLPSGVNFSFNPAGSVSLTNSGVNPVIGSLIARLRSDNGIPGSDGLLGTGTPVKDARLRLDQIPTTSATWSTGLGGTTINIGTAASSGPNQYIGGIQVALSTAVDTVPFAAPAGGERQKLTYADDGGTNRKFLGVQVYGLDEFHFATTAASRGLSLGYGADSARPLVVDVDAAFGNKFFADYDVDATLTVTDIPKTWDFSTDFATKLDVTSSGGSVSKIEVLGDIGSKSGMDVHTTNVVARVTGVPGLVHFLLVPQEEGKAELTLSNPITQVFVELKSDTKVMGGDYKHIMASVNDIPAKWTATWGLNPNPHAELAADAPLGAVSVVLSKKVASETPGMYSVFQSPGGTVQYTAFTREIDRRYLREGQGDENVREQAYMSRLDSLYNSTSQLTSGEDHLIMRKDDAGKSEFISFKGTGFQGLSASLADDTLTASVNINFPGNHPFFVGLEQYRPDADAIAAGKVAKFMTVDIQNIPDTTTVTVSPNKAYVDFSDSPGRILVYKGPLPGAADGQDALKVLVPDAPKFIHLDVDLTLNGGIFLATEKPTEVALLNQSSSNRIVADFSLQNLSVDWGLETMEVDFETDYDPITGEIPIAEWIVFNFVKAFVDISASPGVDGFLQSYKFIGGAQTLDDDTNPDFAPGSPNQYVPNFSVLADNMTGVFHLEAGIRVYLVGLGIPTGHVPGVPVPYIDANIGALSAANFDWWDMGGGPLDGAFLGDPDYIDNDPWDIWPLLHFQDGHLAPFI